MRVPGYQLRSSRKLILDQVELNAANVNTPGAQVTLSAAVPYDQQAVSVKTPGDCCYLHGAAALP